MAPGLLTIEGRQGENRSQASRKISKKSPGKNEPGYKPFIPLAASKPATCRSNPRLAWLRPHFLPNASLEVCMPGPFGLMSSRTFADRGRRTLVRNGASVTLASRQLAAAASFMHAFAWVDPKREAHPGGNVTGIAPYVRGLPATVRTRQPGARRMGVVDDVTDPKARPQRKESKRSARRGPLQGKPALRADEVMD